MSRKQREAAIAQHTDTLSAFARVVGAAEHLINVKDNGKKPNDRSWNALREALEDLPQS